MICGCSHKEQKHYSCVNVPFGHKGKEPRTQRPSVTSLWDSCDAWGWACPLMLGGSHSTLFFSKNPSTLRRIWSSCLGYQMDRWRRVCVCVCVGGGGHVRQETHHDPNSALLGWCCWQAVPMATEWDWSPNTPHQNWRTFICFFYYSTAMGLELKTNVPNEQIPKTILRGPKFIENKIKQIINFGCFMNSVAPLWYFRTSLHLILSILSWR